MTKKRFHLFNLKNNFKTKKNSYQSKIDPLEAQAQTQKWQNWDRDEPLLTKTALIYHKSYLSLTQTQHESGSDLKNDHL